MTKRVELGLVSAAVLAVSACGGGGSGGSTGGPVSPPPPPPPPPPVTFELSGQVLADPVFEVDGDLNDENDVPLSNNSLVQAQLINSETEIRGYVTRFETNRAGDNFRQTADPSDFFEASLLAGQVISLSIADFSGTNGDIDLDLYLLDSSGGLVSSSIAFSSQIEQVTVLRDGNYFIEVDAFRGASNYSLTISSGATTTPQNGGQVNVDNMRLDQVVQLRSGANAFSGRLKETNTDGSIFQAPSAFDDVRPMIIDPSSLSMAEDGPFSLDHAEKKLGLTPNQINDPAYRAKLALLHHIKSSNGEARADVLAPAHVKTLHASPPPDPLLQWNLPLTEWEEALDDLEAVIPNPERPLIAILDSGVFSAHPAIAPVLTDARDFVPETIDGDGFDGEAEEDVDINDPNPDDCFDFHGTHVASTAVAPTGLSEIRGRTMVGGLPFADLMMLKLGYNRDPQCRFIVGDVAGAIRYAAGLPNSSGQLPDRPADVINMSFGGPEPNPATRAAIRDAVAAGVIIVASAGNDGEESVQFPNYPAAFPDVISVAAIDINADRAPYSSFYPQVEIAAPGGDGRFDRNGDGLADAIVGGVARPNSGNTDFEPRYALYQGTSMAAPHVAAGFALMKSIYPELTSDEAHRLIEEGLLTTDLATPGRDSETGFGLMSFRKMVDVALELRDGGFELPADFRIDPTSVDLGNLSSGTELTVSRSGNPTFTIDSLAFTASNLDDTQLLDPVAVEVDAEGFGRYEISIDRSRIQAGSYVAEVIISASDGRTKSVPVTFRIPDASLAAETGPARFALQQLQNGSFETVLEFVVTSGAGADFTLTDVGEGDFRLIFTTDMDNDGEICDAGEIGGTYPGQACDSTETFTLPGDEGTLIEAVLERLPD